MKRNVAPLLAIAFIVAAISTGVFYGLFASKLGAASNGPTRRTTVLAARDLPAGAVIKAEDLKLSEVHGGSPPAGSFDSPDPLIGASVLSPVHNGDPLTQSVVALKDMSGGSAIPSGMRAVSIHVFESSGVLPLLHRGSKVDLQAVLEANGTVSLSPVLQDIEVFSVNPEPEPIQGSRVAAPVVTVLTRPDDSDILALADSGTRLRLAVRNPADNAVDNRKAMAVPSLFRERPAARPAAANASPAGKSAQGR